MKVAHWLHGSQASGFSDHAWWRCGRYLQPAYPVCSGIAGLVLSSSILVRFGGDGCYSRACFLALLGLAFTGRLRVQRHGNPNPLHQA